MKINSIILGAFYSCQANNYADMKVCIVDSNLKVYHP